jgi:phosphodiesterase/alkaline phosphatase D-like protein
MIEYRMAKVDPDLPFEDHLTSANPNLKSGLVETDGSTDWIVKLDVHGLDPFSQYVFAFTDGSISSDVGLTKTAPAADQSVDNVTYAVFSCSNFPNGYFHAYDIGTYLHCSLFETIDSSERVASTIAGLDLWIHVGDYIYEYGDWQTWARDAEAQSLSMPSLLVPCMSGMGGKGMTTLSVVMLSDGPIHEPGTDNANEHANEPLPLKK